MLDATTIFVVSILADALFCLCGLLLWRAQPKMPGMLPLALTFAARGVGFTLLGIAPLTSPFFAIWFGNVFLTLSVVLMLEGFARFLGQRPPRRTQILSLSIVALSWPIMLSLWPGNIIIRISILAFVVAVMYGRCALLFLCDRTQPAALRSFTVAWSSLIAIICLSWGFGSWFAAPEGLLVPNAFQALYLLVHLLSFLVKGVMTAILVGVRLRDELLAHVEEQRTQLLMLSHELRTPIAITARSSELLQSFDLAKDPVFSRRLDQIQMSAARMSTLVEHFLSETRQNESSGGPDHFDLAAEIRRLATSPRLVLDIPTHLAFTGDRRAIDVIFSNIIDNALKYSSADSTVDVRLSNENGVVKLILKDRGIGLGTDESASRLGERFYRGENVDQIPGVGLGLYTVRKNVESQGGRFSIGARDGGGTVVTIAFERRDHAA